MYKSPLETLVNLITPEQCHLCSSDSDMLCGQCREEVIGEQDSRCYKCNRITVQSRVCRSCSSSSSLRRVWWLGNYKDCLKDLIKTMKFNRKRSYAREFGDYLAEVLPYIPENTLVIPVPTASVRVRRRGFDQADLISRGFALKRSLKLVPALRRTSQVDQIGKRRSERILQMNQSFEVIKNKKEALSGASVLLIDDVVTTGATLEAAAKLLRKNGAKHVDAAVVARHLLG